MTSFHLTCERDETLRIMTCPVTYCTVTPQARGRAGRRRRTCRRCWAWRRSASCRSPRSSSCSTRCWRRRPTTCRTPPTPSGCGPTCRGTPATHRSTTRRSGQPLRVVLQGCLTNPGGLVRLNVSHLFPCFDFLLSLSEVQYPLHCQPANTGCRRQIADLQFTGVKQIS